MVSFVWAFLPFKFAITLYPALVEMQAATLICKEHLLCDRDDSAQHGDADTVSAESSLQLMMTQVAAAGITAGRSSEVYGIVMPVRAPQVHPQLNFAALF